MREYLPLKDSKPFAASTPERRPPATLGMNLPQTCAQCWYDGFTFKNSNGLRVNILWLYWIVTSATQAPVKTCYPHLQYLHICSYGRTFWPRKESVGEMSSSCMCAFPLKYTLESPGSIIHINGFHFVFFCICFWVTLQLNPHRP